MRRREGARHCPTKAGKDASESRETRGPGQGLLAPWGERSVFRCWRAERRGAQGGRLRFPALRPLLWNLEPQLLHHQLKILPGLALRLDLLGARSQEVRGVERRHEQRLSAIELPLAAKLGDAHLGLEERRHR